MDRVLLRPPCTDPGPNSEAKLFHLEGTEVLMNLWPFFVNMHSDSSCELKCNTYNKHQDCKKKKLIRKCFVLLFLFFFIDLNLSTCRFSTDTHTHNYFPHTK